MLKELLKIISSEEFAGWLTSLDGWRSLDVDYFPPRVERLYRWIYIDGEECRLYLHMIHFTEKPCLFHKHRWPSAIVLLEGGYEMGISYSEDDVITENAWQLPRACTMLLNEGSGYEMTNPHGLHYVKPVTEYSLSVMLSGPPYKEVETKEALDRRLEELPIEDQQIILKKFREKIEKMYGNK